jgi:hypothetical protein
MENSKVVDVNFSSMLWAQITNLAYADNCSKNSVVLALLFQEMYGKCAYVELKKYAAELRAKSRRDFELEIDEIEKSDDVDENENNPPDIIKSRERTTTADIKFFGKADTPRAIYMPIKMHADLNRHASKQPGSPVVSVFLREVMFRLLNGSVMHERWQNERSLLQSSRGV